MTRTALPPIEVGGRRTRVTEALSAAEVDVLVVAARSNVRWLTGFTGSNGMVLASPHEWHLYTDSRYEVQAPVELAAGGVDAHVHIGDDVWKAVAARSKTERVGVESDHVTWAQVKPLLDDSGAGSLVATTEVIDILRARKDDAELARIRVAASAVDAALAEVLPRLAPDVAEVDFARLLDDAIRDGDADGPAYETIVAGGPNSALPHARPTDRRFEEGDLIVVDVGAEIDGYRSDMTRSFVLGAPTRAQSRQLDVVSAAQQAGLARVRAGVRCADVDVAARTVIDEAGWGEEFGHGTGHGVGLDIHELPRVNSRSDAVLETGMVITVEPGVYLAGHGGVRWEDLLVVTDSGVEVLTRSPKEPVLDV